MAQQLPVGQDLPYCRGFTITLNDAPQPVGFLWTSDRPVADTSI